MNILPYLNRPGSVFVEQLDDFFSRMTESGLLEIYKRWCRQTLKFEMPVEKKGNELNLITFEAIRPLFLLYGFFIGVSVIVFLGELLVGWVKKG